MKTTVLIEMLERTLEFERHFINNPTLDKEVEIYDPLTGICLPIHKVSSKASNDVIKLIPIEFPLK